MELSVVILNYNAAPFLRLCLDSVIRATQKISSEIIVADNCSTDDSVQLVREKYPQVTLLPFGSNYGFSKGNNLAVKQARGTYLCILNPDTIVGENVFLNCLAFAKANSNLGVVGTQLIDGSGTFLPESKRHLPTPKVARAKFLGHDDKYYFNDIDKDSRGPVEILVGAFMFCRKKVYQDLGGFDERYFMYGEDIDLSYTALTNNLQNYYLGDALVVHFKGESTVKDKKYLKRFYGAMELFYDKYFKRNLLEKLVVKIAVKVLSIKPIKNTQPNPKIKKKILVTNQVNKGLSSFDEVCSMDTLPATSCSNTALYWDINSLLIEDVLRYMKDNPRSFLYRFLSLDRSTAVGSDDKNSQGKIEIF
ncbi:glycosyltransferase family 2 protein [Nonlabens tegetincola]|uniref:glycosyltransferase family 2 protein n=1 Tax=Nonlabens tegetincola TaxID=323273 RepID=UPI000CF564C9|nr:glycosyltransferase family 2 protein [Nonlabens tegetincola]PQJ14269.1 glycosyl transferase family 2 [Nonlabens tegetincola]